MSASTIFSKEFVKAIVGYLTKSCENGAAVTRPELAKEIRKNYGRKLDYTDLNMWLSSSVNLGLFDTDDAKFRTKRGVGGGIVRVGSVAPAAPKKAKRARKAKAAPKTAPVTQAAPVVAPTAAPEAQVSEPIQA